MRSLILCLVAATAIGQSAGQGTAKHAEVLMLGVYHMAKRPST
jgi:hypothetical protein